MTLFRSPSIERWLGSPIEGCRCGSEHRVGVREILLGAGAIDHLIEGLSFVESVAAADTASRGTGQTPAQTRRGTRRAPSRGDGGRERGAGPLLLIADPDTWDAAGSRVAAGLRGGGRTVREAILGRRPHADDRELARLRTALECGPSRIVAVGAGTIGDLGKALAAEAGVPLLTVGTAASMNGYTSSIAALTISGLKRTAPAPPPDLLVLDTDVLAAAPARLTRAGFGDLASKPVSGADWVLSNLLLGEALCPAALALADEAVGRARARAAEIGRGERDAVAVLAEALALSGMSMSIAGASSPASGGEHLLSHYLDISAEGWHRESRLHGEQVAVGTLVSLALYSRARSEGRAALPAHRETPSDGRGALSEASSEADSRHGTQPDAGMDSAIDERVRADIERSAPSGSRRSRAGNAERRASRAPGEDGRPVPPEESSKRLETLHAHLPPPALASLLAEAGAKAARSPGREERLRTLDSGWESIWGKLDGQLAGGAGLAEDLARAGAPRSFAEIGVGRERAAELIRIARHMRNRYTVLDLAADLDRLDAWAEEIAEALAG